MKHVPILIVVIALICCDRKTNSTAQVFLSNHSFEVFDESLFKVFANDELILMDSVKNQYLSFHWRDSVVRVPKNDFKLRVIINSNGYEVERDTIVSYSDSLRIFITFNFSPNRKRYRNSEIYKYLPRETSRLKEIADSLYANNVLKNASEYLNDTIPLRNSIDISVQR